MPPQHLSRLSRLFLRYGGVYLVYLATMVRASTLYASLPQRPVALGLLGLYGALLLLAIWFWDAPVASEAPAQFPKGHRWRLAYLLAQSAIAVGLQAAPPRLEILALLFIPLSLQAVRFFGRRLGFGWIAAFIVAITPAVMSEFGWSFVGLIMVAVYGGACLLMGYNADLIGRADAARQANERLIGDLRTAHRELQVYAAQVAGFAASQTRRQMARELHDSAAQTIFSMNLASQTAAVLLQRDPSRVPEQLERLQALAHNATREIQALADQLRPDSLAGSGLPAALRRLAAERAARDDLTVRVEVIGERELSGAVAEGLWRIVQEALSNVAKHAGATEALVRLELSRPARLVIADAGFGFDPRDARASRGHVGLAGMAERSQELGWRFTCDSAPRAGTRIIVEEAIP
jgi:signal transduction histidine kinase